jgi:YkoY family integral membrane protein
MKLPEKGRLSSGQYDGMIFVSKPLFFILSRRFNLYMLDKLLNFPDQFSAQTLLLLVVLVALEAVLSADNAIALAAITQGLQDPKLEQRALTIGLVFAYILRMTLIVTASWVIGFWQFELAGALYLLWLVFQYFTSETEDGEHHHGPRFKSLWQAIPVIAFTDLAFSLDSVTTAIAVSNELWLILIGGTIGIIALRFMAGLFIRWLGEYSHLEDAGYLTVALVGIRLLFRVINDSFVPPEWLMITMIGVLFAWGFSERKLSLDVPAESLPVAENSEVGENSAMEVKEER